MRPTTQQSGFTLMEALVVLSIVGILAGIAVPAVRDAGEAGRSSAAQAALLESWLGGVSQSAATGTEVVLCPGDAGGCRGGTDWSDGWILFADPDGNRIRGTDETLLKAIGPLPGKVHIRSTVGRTRVVFQPNGGTAGSNVTFTLCDGRGAAKATTIVLSNTGGMRSGAPTTAAAEACTLPG